MEKARQVLLGLLVVSAAVMAATEKPDKGVMTLFQEAQYQEQTAGDLDKAIELYQKVVTDSAEIEKLAARATFQLGMCYLKKDDKPKAAHYFSEVLSKFSNQTTLADKARLELKKISPSDDQDLQSQLIAYLFSLQKRTYSQAKILGIKSNTVVYVLDEAFVKMQCGLTAIENESAEPVKDEITIGNFDSSMEIELYNESLQVQKARFEETGQEIGKYRLMWTPDTPLMPGEMRLLGYRAVMPEPLPKSSQGCDLVMKNSFGPEVLENLVAVLPVSLEITNESNVTEHQRIGTYDIYSWQKRVPANTTHDMVLTLKTRESYSDSAKPAVIGSFPETYSNDVDPALKEMWVTFDQDMHQYGWSWCRTGSPDIFPKITGDPFYKDKRTCVAPVKVAAGRAYLVLINSEIHEGFKNSNMIPARPYAIVFATKDTLGSPTEIPANLLKKAQEINAKSAVPEPFMAIIPSAVSAYITNKFTETYQTATAKGLRSNSHVHIIDENMNHRFGGIDIFQNKTQDVLDKEIAMGSFDGDDLNLFDDKGVRQKTRMIKIPGSNYRLFWTPSHPIAPDETRTLLWMGSGKGRTLTPDENRQYHFKMGNHYGAPVIEDFYLVLPAGVQLNDQTTEYTSHETIEGYDVYCWSKEQGKSVNHRVEITFEKKK